jgi:two-component system C4-dicarboxylate transport sensor histidine kinase DctB
VADGAGGLPPEVAAAPFTPYLTTKAGGTGLGLVLCRDLALRLGGRLELHNEPGRGLRAEVVLKAASLAGEAPQPR